jgi:hypothetical protein
MTLSDKIAVASLCFTVVTTLCVIVLAYLALAQTVRPSITATLVSSINLRCGQESLISFALVNDGHWYGSPMAVDVTVFCNFPPAFELREIRYGSVQEYRNSDVRIGVGGMRFLKVKGIKLARHESPEEIHVLVVAPDKPGSYRARLAAYSANDASLSQDFELVCANMLPASRSIAPRDPAHS